MKTPGMADMPGNHRRNPMLWSSLFLRDPTNIVAFRCDLQATSCLGRMGRSSLVLLLGSLVFGFWPLVLGLWPLVFDLSWTWITKAEIPK